MIRNLISRLWQSFLNLNLFKKPSSNEQTLEKERLATRIYLIALLIFLLGVTIIAALIVRTVEKIEYKPSSKKFSQLYRDYPTTLRCPCTKVAITYDKFITTQVKFHQVCSSQFVQQTWINELFINKKISYESINDARIILSFFWQTIAGLCMASNKSWNNILANFGATRLITPTVVSEEVIQTQSKEAIRNQIIQSKTTLTGNIHALQSVTRASQVVSALQTNYYLRYRPKHLGPCSPKMTARRFGNCTCLNIQGCPRPATFTNHYGHLITIPGMIIDCLVVDGTLASTLECYYNQSCISLLHDQTTIEVQPLSTNLNKYFSINSTIQMILNELMIDDTTTAIQFDLYFAECNSDFCSYSYTHRFDILFIFTTVTGFSSVLSFILRFIAPYIASIILRRKNQTVPTENKLHVTSLNQNPSIWNRMRILTKSLCQKILFLNLFENETRCSSIDICRQQLLTRVFIFLITSLSIGTGIYKIVVKRSHVMTVPYPSLSIYEQLYNEYGDTLDCHCSQISIPNEAFLNITFVVHQVCSSDLVSREWLDYLSSFDPAHIPSCNKYNQGDDFRSIGLSYFQLLTTFCSLVKMNIAEAQNIFMDAKFINDRVPSSTRFIQQTKAMTDSFIRTTHNNFASTVMILSLTFTTDNYFYGRNTNLDITMNNNSQVVIEPTRYDVISFISDTTYAVNGKCSCRSVSANCLGLTLLNTNISLFDEINRVFFRIVYAECSPLRSFFSSKTKWWYDIVYMEHILATYRTVTGSQPVPNLKPLNISTWTQLDDASTEDLLNQMLLKNTTDTNALFDKFYNECAPSSCSYTIIRRRDYIVILFLFVSVCGGLNKGLRLLVPLIGKIFFICLDWWKNRTNRQGSSSRRIHLTHLSTMGYKKLQNLNLYRTDTSADNANIQQQQIYTRVYLFLYIIILGIVLFYTAFIERRVSKTFYSPSIDQYEELLSHHRDDMNCPCTYVSILYDEFITQLEVTSFHHACQTERLHAMLRQGRYFPAGEATEGKLPYYIWMMPFLRSLENLCSLAKDNIDNSINVFKASSMFNNQLMTRDQFINEINETLNQLEKRTKTAFVQLLDLARSTVQGNALLQTSLQAWNLSVVKTDEENNAVFLTIPTVVHNTYANANCSCSTLRTCIIPRHVFSSHHSITSDGMVIGCHYLETLLFSSLSCFYSLPCIQFLRNISELSVYSFENPEPLNASETRFSINDTIETLAYEMFIESWTNNASYERYFNSCLPSYCTYTYYQRFDTLEMLTTFLSVFGGISLVIHFIVPYLVKLSKRILICCRDAS